MRHSKKKKKSKRQTLPNSLVLDKYQHTIHKEDGFMKRRKRSRITQPKTPTTQPISLPGPVTGSNPNPPITGSNPNPTPSKARFPVYGTTPVGNRFPIYGSNPNPTPSGARVVRTGSNPNAPTVQRGPSGVLSTSNRVRHYYRNSDILPSRKTVAGAAGATLGYITNNVPGAVAGWELGRAFG